MLQMLKRSDTPFRPVIDIKNDAGLRETASRIRCPQCDWTPDAHSRWCCDHHYTPEPPFPSCGAVWDTFATHGQCPGCGHQWQWTSCLACGQPSPHEEWYEAS